VPRATENPSGREQLLLTAPELQTHLGRKFVNETELLPLLIAHGLIRRVSTIQIEVRTLGAEIVSSLQGYAPEAAFGRYWQ
jgi:hypothetical protein